jgi:hypothetical protein
MDIVFRLFSITFNDVMPQWWRTGDHLRRVFQHIDDLGLWKRLTIVGIDGGKKTHKIKSLDGIIDETRSWKENPYILRSTKDDQGIFFGITLRKRGLNLFLRLNGDELENRRDWLLEKLVSFGRGMHDEFRTEALLGPDFQVTLLNAAYPRPRPPRQHPLWPVGSLVDFISKSYRQRQTGDPPDAIERLLSSPLPPGVSREDLGDLLIFRWIDDLVDERRIAAARGQQERWFARVLDLPRAAGFNNLGDFLETPFSLRPHPPLTFYDDSLMEGYKAVVLDKENHADPGLIADMGEWISNRSLPDGTVLAKLHVILPNRNSARSFQERASALGIGKVLYTDNQGALWNIDPPGLWLEGNDTELE